jgi:two-component system sensor histidine kinase RegB
LNLVLTVSPPASGRLDDRQATLFLAYDLLQLGVLLFLTGGLHNPFVILILAPVTVSATILSRQSTIALAALALLVVTVLAIWHYPLPWSKPELDFPELFVLGLWIALVSTTLFLASYILAVAEEARRMSDALAATQIALAREQRVSALGGLAAAAAHELGTPLSTIAVIAKELAREFPTDGAHAEDVRLLVAQIERCRDILAELSGLPEDDPDSPLERLPLSALIEVAALPYERDDIEIHLMPAALGGESASEPVVRRSPEIFHGLGTLLQNAIQFARSRVDIDVAWTAGDATVTIRDDGPGFPADVLAEIGEPYVSGRAGRDGHMGLGVFIALTLLGRTGAALAFDNWRREGGAPAGARVVIRWDRGKLERQSLIQGRT